MRLELQRTLLAELRRRFRLERPHRRFRREAIETRGARRESGRAQLAASVAWPAALIIVLWVFRADIKQLLPRLRKAYGTELDPANQSVALPSAGALAPAE